MLHLLVETPEGIQAVERRFGPKPDGTWHTPSAFLWERLLTEGARVVSIEQLVTQDDVNRLGELGFAMARGLARVLDTDAVSTRCGIQLGQAVYPQLKRTLDPLLVRAVLANRWMAERLREPDATVVVTGTPRSTPVSVDFLRFRDADTLFYQLIARSTWKPRVTLLETTAPEEDPSEARVPRRGTKVAAVRLLGTPLGWSTVCYRVWQRVFRGRLVRLPWLVPKTDVMVFRTNELIQAAFSSLLWRGISVTEIQCAANGRATRSGGAGLTFDDARLFKRLEEEFVQVAATHGERGPCLEAAASLMAQRLGQFLTGFVPFAVRMQGRLIPPARGQTASRRVLLTNGLTDPVERLCYQHARQQGVSVVVVQHGGAAGLTTHHQHNADIFDITACEGYLHRHQNGLEFYRSVLHEKMPVSELIGTPRSLQGGHFPRLSRLTARRLLGLDSHERVVMYVTNVLQGPWLAIPYGHLDTHYYTLLRHVVCEVFRGVEATCVVKLYPDRRGQLPHPLTACPAVPPNVRLTQDVDFRHIRWAADVIISDVPYSTLGWALGTETPTILLDLPFNPLLPHMRPAIEQALFLVDCRTPGWEARLLGLLTMPPDALEHQWQEEREAREAFIQRCVFGPAGHPAKRISDFVLGFQPQ